MHASSLRRETKALRHILSLGCALQLLLLASSASADWRGALGRVWNKITPPAPPPNLARETQRATQFKKLYEPAALKRHRGTAVYVLKDKNKLFRNGLSYKDPVQSDGRFARDGLGECGLIAGLSAVALQEPQAIRDAIQRNSDGSYTVSLYHNFLNGRGYDRVQIRVSPAILVDEKTGKPLYATSTSPNERWVQVMEKAFAVYKEKYHGMKSAGWQRDGYRALRSIDAMEVMGRITGRGAHYTRLAKMSGLRFDEKFTRILAEGGMVTASSKPAAKGSLETAPGSGIVGGHAYTVVKIFATPDGMRIQLRNPWGGRERTDKGIRGSGASRGGVFTMRFSEFFEHFQMIKYVKGKDSQPAPVDDDSGDIA